MFKKIIQLEYTKKVTNMSYMFSKCSSLKSSEGIAKWKTNQNVDKSNMFQDCTLLSSSNEISE